MNQLRMLMLDKWRRRNFADTSIRSYPHGDARFSRYFRRPPDQLGPEDIRKYRRCSSSFRSRISTPYSTTSVTLTECESDPEVAVSAEPV